MEPVTLLGMLVIIIVFHIVLSVFVLFQGCKNSLLAWQHCARHVLLQRSTS